MSKAQRGTTPVGGEEIFRSASKQVLVTRDPVFVHKGVIEGRYIGQQPDTCIYWSILVTIINPIFGPIALIFSLMSDRAYKNGDIRYAAKWAMHAMTACMIIFIASVIIYIAIGFTLSPIGIKGGHTY